MLPVPDDINSDSPALIKRMVKHHGGSLPVESSPGKGICFYFTLPVS